MSDRVDELTKRFHALMLEYNIPHYVSAFDVGQGLFTVSSSGPTLWTVGAGEFIKRQGTYQLLQQAQTTTATVPNAGPMPAGGTA